jgi:glucose/arabinose dehydrogenase
MAPGYCVGLVAGPGENGFRRRLMKSPRTLLQLPDGNRWLVSDLGGWTAGRGAIWMLQVAGPGRVHIKPVITQLNLPHTLAHGPDSKVYANDMGRIFRFDPTAPDPAATIEQIIGGLPDNRLHEDRHPLPHFIFDGNHDLLVNIGAATDQCASGTPPTSEATCPEDGVRAIIRRYQYTGDGRWKSEPEVLARGLRNSMVIVRHESGTLLQAENSYDFAPKSERPYEEINVLRSGAHYGWPYCWDMNQLTPLWRSSGAMDCDGSQHEKPVALLPPHSAPLAATYYAGAMFPQLKGKLLMTWHGYRPTGSRLVAIEVDARGIPLMSQASHPQLTVLTPGWDLEPGVRPAGAPVGITVAHDGALWIADDRNATILRIAADEQ